MERRKLGTSGIEVSAVALGCMSLSGNMTYADIPESQALATIDAALDAGINFFDNAPAYGDGEAERRLGNALRGPKRDRAVIATKIGHATLTREDVMREFEVSLKRLETDRIDLYQIHWPRHVTPLEETLRAMEDLIRSGKARAIGVCNFGNIDFAEAVGISNTIVSNQMAYSLLGRAVEFDVIPLCKQHSVGLLCYSPLAQGLLTGRYHSADDVPAERARTRHFAGTRQQSRHGQAGAEAQTFDTINRIRTIAEEAGEEMADVAIAWLLQQPAVTSVLVGASRPEQVVRNAKASQVWLSPETLQRLDESTDGLKQTLGANPDMWQSTSRIR